MTAAWATQPGFVRALGAVRGAEIGLLRAVALDIVVAGEGTALEQLGQQAKELLSLLLGPSSLELQAHGNADGSAVTFLGKATRGIVVSAHLSVVSSAHSDVLRAQVRLAGTHGSVLVDLTRPELTVRTPAERKHVAFGLPGRASVAVDASSILTAIAESVESGNTARASW